MKTNIKTGFLASALTLLLSACTSTSSTNSGFSDSKAADYNAQLGVGYLQKGRLDLSKQYLEKALNTNPKDIDANHYYALLQERLGDDAKASHYFNRAVRLSKTPSSELMNNHGSHLCRIGQYDKAIRAFNMALKDPLYRTPEFAYTNIGVCLKRQGNASQAGQYFQKALEANSVFALALYQLAELHYDLGDYAKAQAYWYRHQEQSAASAESLYLCANINSALGDNAQAEQCVAKLLAQFPASAEAKKIN